MTTQQDTHKPAWLKRLVLVLVAALVVSALASVFASRTTRTQQYIGRVKLMERAPAGSHAGVKADLYSDAFRRKVTRSAANAMKLYNMNVTPEALFDATKIEPIPDSQVIKVEVISSDDKQMALQSGAVALEIAKTYAEVANGPAGAQKGGSAATLKVVEGPHVFPVNMSHPSRLVLAIGIVIVQICLVLLLFIGAAYLWAKIQVSVRT